MLLTHTDTGITVTSKNPINFENLSDTNWCVIHDSDKRYMSQVISLEEAFRYIYNNTDDRYNFVDLSHFIY